jgi:uncharacterized hydrophobic protein (TIGR00271 family)
MERILGTIDQARRHEVLEGLGQSADIDRDYILLAILSCVIATFGLILDSGAIIIGAMLIAPLMPSILAFALGLVRGDLRQLGQALGTLVVGVLLAVALSTALGRLVSTDSFNFLEQLPGEITGRTQPTLFDLAVALAGGAAAAYALAQPHLSATLPGVAIATALMPPLCVVGIGLAQGKMNVSMGAWLLFLSNFAAIAFASSVVFVGLGFGPRPFKKRRIVISRALLVSGALLLLVAIPLAGFMIGILGDIREDTSIRETISEQLVLVSEDSSLVSFEKQRQSEYLEIAATIYAPRNLTHAEVSRLQDQVALQLQQPVALRIFVVRVAKLDPRIPPTFTSTPLPDATATATPSVTPSPTATPTSTPTDTPTATPTFTPTPTDTPTPTPTPVSYAVVSGTGGRGVKVHREPGLDTPVITAISEGTVVQLGEGRAEVDDLGWLEVILADGREGWVAERYLSPFEGEE